MKHASKPVEEVILMPRLEEELPTLDTPKGKTIFAAGFFGFIACSALLWGAIGAGSAMLRDTTGSKFDDIKVTSHVRGASTQHGGAQAGEPAQN